MRNSPLIQVWKNNKLVDLFIYCPTATCDLPTKFEEELVRIMKEYNKLKELNNA